MRSDRGYSFGEVLMVVAVVAIVAAMAVPSVLGSLDNLRLGMAARNVHGELQRARLKAVSSNRPMRMRFNCPQAGWFRAVELLGTPAAPDALDVSAGRCDPLTYPFRAPAANRLARPNNDGPVQPLRPGITLVSSPTIEFWPDGTAHADTGAGVPWPVIGAPVAITLQYKTRTTSITVNGVGKVQIQ